MRATGWGWGVDRDSGRVMEGGQGWCESNEDGTGMVSE